MSKGGKIEIRSYRVCFDLERRIHKIDRWRVPLPYGVPVRGIAYGAAALLAVAVLSGLPVTGELLGLLHPALRFGVLPIGAAALLTRWSLDGRSAHRVGLAWLRLQVEPRAIGSFRRLQAQRPVLLEPVAVASDERSSRLGRGVVEGPARVILRYPVETRARGKSLRVAQAGAEPRWQGTEVELRRGQRLVTR